MNTYLKMSQVHYICLIIFIYISYFNSHSVAINNSTSRSAETFQQIYAIKDVDNIYFMNKYYNKDNNNLSTDTTSTTSTTTTTRTTTKTTTTSRTSFSKSECLITGGEVSGGLLLLITDVNTEETITIPILPQYRDSTSVTSSYIRGNTQNPGFEVLSRGVDGRSSAVVLRYNWISGCDFQVS